VNPKADSRPVPETETGTETAAKGTGTAKAMARMEAAHQARIPMPVAATVRMKAIPATPEVATTAVTTTERWKLRRGLLDRSRRGLPHNETVVEVW